MITMNKAARYMLFAAAALLLAALVLEALPVGAVIVFAPGPDSRVARTFSFFSLIPPGYADFFPLLSGVCTVMAALLTTLLLIRRRARGISALVFCCAAAIFSLLPALVFGTSHMNAASWVIFALLIASCALQAVAVARGK